MTTETLGWFASGLVFATFCARQMMTLRLLAIASNLAFVAYAYENHLWPIVSLHLAMLPINVFRAHQLIAAFRTEGNGAGYALVSVPSCVRVLARLARNAVKPRAAI